MELRNDILDELRPSFPTLSGVGNHNVLSLPTGYFEAFSQQILDQLRFITQVPLALKTPFTAPESYFDTLPENILLRIHQDNELDVLPVLQSLKKSTPYHVPAGYFDSPVNIPKQQSQPAKVVPFKKYRRVLQYVAAAMLGGILVTGAFLYTDSNSYLSNEKAGNEVTDSSDNGIDASLSTETVGVHQHLETIIGKKKAPGFVKMIQSLTEEEMNSYLEENAPSESIQVIEEGEDTK